MIVRPAAGGLMVTLDARLVPSTSGVRYGSACLLLGLALVFGGGTKQGLWSDALIEIPALAILAIAFWNVGWRELDRVARCGFMLAALALIIPLLELIPLPPMLWHALPGRAQIAQELAQVGLSQIWQPITLAPRECWMALLAMVPAVASFVLSAQLESRQRRTLVRIFMVWISITVVLCLLQMTAGPESPLRFYAETNSDRAVGFFANSNHNALALSLAAPFVILSPFAAASTRASPVRVLLAACLLVLIVVAVGLTRSRAGVGLVFLSTVLSGAMVLLRTDSGQPRGRYLLAALCLGTIAAFAAFQTGFVGISERFDASLAGDLRWGILNVSSTAALHFLPVGSGLGSFVSVFDRFAPLSLVQSAYVNHAHDDWLELGIELGILWPVIAVAFLLWVAFATRDQWRRYGRLVRDKLSCCLIALILVGFASAVDYPLRTIALMSFFGMICGFLVEPPLLEVAAEGAMTSPTSGVRSRGAGGRERA